MPARPVLHHLFRTFCIGAFCVSFLAILGGGTCYWVTDDDDEHCFDDDTDNDYGCDDDDHFDVTSPDGGRPAASDIQIDLSQLGGGLAVDATYTSNYLLFPELRGGSTQLVDFAVDLDPRPGRHPVARIRDISGLSVFEVHATGILGPDDFSRYTSRVLEDNAELIGLPPAAGHLRPRTVHFLDSLVAVVHEQVPGPRGDPAAPPLPDAQVIFAFDLLGRLLQIENRTTLPPGVVVPLPPDVLAGR